MKKINFLGSLLLSFTACSAYAADIDTDYITPTETTVDWTGLYVGGSIGYRLGNVEWVHNENIGTDERFSVNPNGFIGGFHIGLQKQIESYVFGVEAAYMDGSSEADQDSGAGAINPGNPRRRTAVLSNVSSIAARMGIVHDQWLLYGKLGYAQADIEINHRLISTGFLFPKNHWDNEEGFIIGAGFDYRLTENMSAGIDYSYLDFGGAPRNQIESTNCNGQLCGDTLSDVNMSVITARVSFHF